VVCCPDVTCDIYSFDSRSKKLLEKWHEMHAKKGMYIQLLTAGLTETYSFIELLAWGYMVVHSEFQFMDLIKRGCYAVAC